MNFLKYMVLCLAVASSAQVFGARHVVTAPTADVAAIAAILEKNGVKGGRILPRHIISSCITVFCEDDKWTRQDFKSVNEIIALLPKLIGSFFLSWNWIKNSINPLNWSSKPAYQVALTFKKQPWYKTVFGQKEIVASFNIRNADFEPTGIVLLND